jgi:hypothetical protein
VHTHQIIWPVWSGSVRKPVEFSPLPKREAARRWHDARLLERQTRRPGRQDGAIGRNGLLTLHALLFDLTDFRTGRCEPTRAGIARVAGISISSVTRGLRKLKEAGLLDWVRQSSSASRMASTASRSGPAPTSCRRSNAGKASGCARNRPRQRNGDRRRLCLTRTTWRARRTSLAPVSRGGSQHSNTTRMTSWR